MKHEDIAKKICAAHPHLNFGQVLSFLQTLGTDLPTIIATVEGVLGTLKGLLPPAA